MNYIDLGEPTLNKLLAAKKNMHCFGLIHNQNIRCEFQMQVRVKAQNNFWLNELMRKQT